LQRAEILLNRVLRQRLILDEFASRVRILRLEVALNRARGEVEFQRLKLQRREEQLARFQQQIERCTVRAPHDGFLVYANEDDGDPRVELGATVYQKMDLFYLPNLDDMHVITRLNESVVGRVARGMSAYVRFEALPEYELEGQVEMVTALPLYAGGRTSPDVRTFVARVKLDNPPAGLRPGMSAEVRIITDRRSNAVIVPSNAVAFERDAEVCYVPVDAGLQRRRVSVAAATPQWLEVTGGLEPGEEIVLDPSATIAPDMEIVSSPPAPPAQPAQADALAVAP
jgi:HlyD family secretion protein